MYTLLTILIILACLLLTLVVLIQNPKGGGIAANFMNTNQIMGVKRSTDVVEKATWILAIALISLSLLTNFFRPLPNSSEPRDTVIQEQIDNATTPTTNLPSLDQNNGAAPQNGGQPAGGESTTPGDGEQ